MTATIEIGGIRYSTDLQRGRSIAIPMRFNGPQPNSYNVPSASSHAYEDGSFIGDTRQGGGCNFETVSFTPHCNGTHTECIGHILEERISVEETLAPGLLAATLISVSPEDALMSPDSYFLIKDDGDRIITASALRKALDGRDSAFLQALIIRTMPNEVEKRERRYSEQPAPFLSIEAMHVLLEHGVQHLLVDVPSLDRAHDGGNLSVHHLYWNVEQGSHHASSAAHVDRTVTEFIFVPDDLPDGRYLLDLQIAPFVMDAAPSRPVLYTVHD